VVRVLVSLAACREDPEDGRPAESRHQVENDAVLETAEDTVPPTVVLSAPDDTVCTDDVLDNDVSYSATVAIRTQEDFDFDVLGFLDTQRNVNIVGYSRSGDRHPVAESVGVDPAGIRSLPSGDLVIAVPGTGVLKLVTYESGLTSTIVGGLAWPRGLEAGADGMIYASEYYQNGSVRMIDPYTGENEVIAELAFPNAMALTPDEQTLYITTSQGWYGGLGMIAAIDRDADGDWDPTLRLVYESESLMNAITTDVCGNLYVAESSGRVFRIRVDDGGIDPQADLGHSAYGLTAARFGNGLGGFERDELYLSDRTQVYVLEIGIDGRHVLAE
jgi:hypothetical protein